MKNHIKILRFLIVAFALCGYAHAAGYSYAKNSMKTHFFKRKENTGENPAAQPQFDFDILYEQTRLTTLSNEHNPSMERRVPMLPLSELRAMPRNERDISNLLSDEQLIRDRIIGKEESAWPDTDEDEDEVYSWSLVPKASAAEKAATDLEK